MNNKVLHMSEKINLNFFLAKTEANEFLMSSEWVNRKRNNDRKRDSES